MKNILRKHPEAVLITLALVFLGILFCYFSWGIGNVVQEVNQAVNTKTAGTAPPGFNLQAAKQLDLRGLVKPAQ